MKDRAMQALYLLALEPISETTADKSSLDSVNTEVQKMQSVSVFCIYLLIINVNGLWKEI